MGQSREHEFETRAVKLPCFNCDWVMDADGQYPPGPLPRTLELLCPKCRTISFHYMHPPWPAAAPAIKEVAT